MALKRISITLPKDVLDAADKRARALDRSRSWVIVEAIRAYVAAPAGFRVRGRGSHGTVMTTLPRAWPCSTYRRASAVSASG